MLLSSFMSASPHSTVVVAFDFSHTAHVALTRAARLVARAPFHVLHVVCAIDPDQPIPSIPSYDGVDYIYAARVQEALASAVHAELEMADAQRASFFVHARIGKPADEILELAREVGADLIIIGSHNLTGLERWLLGSVAETVVRKAKCTVEVARPKEYRDVELMHVEHVEPSDRHYTPPHRYEYEDHRVLLRPADWPLW